jgi:hypothetical protein
MGLPVAARNPLIDYESNSATVLSITIKSWAAQEQTVKISNQRPQNGISFLGHMRKRAAARCFQPQVSPG